MKRIDPTFAALGAYYQLDTDQRAAFHAALKYVAHFSERMGHSVDYCKPQDETKRRGRPPGSKNRSKPNPLSPESFDAAEFISLNGAITEDL